MSQPTVCPTCKTEYDSAIFLPGQSFHCVHCNRILEAQDLGVDHTLGTVSAVGDPDTQFYHFDDDLPEDDVPTTAFHEEEEPTEARGSDKMISISMEALTAVPLEHEASDTVRIPGIVMEEEEETFPQGPSIETKEQPVLSEELTDPIEPRKPRNARKGRAKQPQDTTDGRAEGAAEEAPKEAQKEPSKASREEFVAGGFFARTFALLVDVSLLYGGCTALAWYLYRQYPPAKLLAVHIQKLPPAFQQFLLTLVLLSAAVTIVLVANFLYYGFFYRLLYASPGKLLFGLQVRHDQHKGPIGVKQAFMREVIGKFLSVFLLLGGFIMAAFREDKMALHDLVFHSQVIKRPKKARASRSS